MSYGTIKVDTITFTDGGVDKSVSVSGLTQNPTFTGNITVTGTISGDLVKGQTISGATVTGGAAQFGTVTGGSAGFTTITGTTVTGTTASFTSGVFVNLSGSSIVLTSGAFASGTAAAPSVSVGSVENGLYSSATNTIAIATSGTGKFFLDGQGKLGIGANPGKRLSLVTLDTTNAVNGLAGLQIVNTDASAGGRMTSVTFGGRTTTAYPFAAIAGILESDSSFEQSGPLVFYTKATTTAVNPDERLRITATGNVAIGLTNPDARLHVRSADYKTFKIESTNANADGSYIEIFANSASPASQDVLGIVSFRGNNSSGNETTYAQIRAILEDTTATSEDGSLSFGSRFNGTYTEKLRINSSGLFGFNTSTPTSVLHVTNNLTSVDGMFLDARTNNTGGGLIISSNTRQATETGVPLIRTITRLGGEGFVTNVTGNVGIGTSVIPNKLTLSTAGTDGIRLAVAGQTYYHMVRPNGDGLYFGADESASGGAGADIRFNVKGSEKVRIIATGWVGVGTIAPSGMIHGYQGIAGNHTVRATSNWSTSGTAPLYTFERAGGLVAGQIRYNDAFGTLQIGSTTSHKFQLYAAGTTVLTVATDQNIGIGTTAPVNIGAGYTGLTVNGSTGAVTYWQSSGTSCGRVLAYNNDFYIGTVQPSGNFIFQHEDGSYERARITASGQLLIGNNQSQVGGGGNSKLQVVSGMLLVSSTNNYVELLPTATGLVITANAYPANLGANASISFKSGSSGGGGPNEIGRFISTGQVVFGTLDTTGLPSTGGVKIKSNAIGSAGTAALALEGTGGDFYPFTFTNNNFSIVSISSAATDYVAWVNGSGTGLFYMFDDGKIQALGIYGYIVGGTNRDVYIDNAGYLGYVSSVRKSKTNIVNLENIDWLYSLEPVRFNRRKYKQVPYTNEEGVTTYVDSPDKEYSEEFYSEIEYGLIAEDVENVAPEFCFYDIVDDQPELRGVHYNKLIAPLLKAVQDLKAENESLKARLDAAGL